MRFSAFEEAQHRVVFEQEDEEEDSFSCEYFIDGSEDDNCSSSEDEEMTPLSSDTDYCPSDSDGSDGGDESDGESIDA